MGVDGIITDRPDIAVRVRDEWVNDNHEGAKARKREARSAGTVPPANSKRFLPKH